MSLTREDVEKIAWLARLEIADDEMSGFVTTLSNIIEFVEQLSAAPTDDVIPMAHPLDMSQRLRADEVTETDERDRFQGNAPAVEAGLYLVPRVIE
ncbi:MAG: Asp-tRNA(Asn)/Glu-tRNA(Gln) amidotransferase subunit GatC [Gammaproteobacteria bacterium]|nr:Asp-tRNA(Asn)/Glu-tRNA(Gln) amidotransferase subunit GatC [Gammaproteobacteria bacterium]NNF60771.1 Asp-tRNA(Asn)/Glu-tRNA(Gln) amidotransferase subunit GatC [Gammaproteobacteria bacterium]NNM20218.1 Asp-tRNA(Asn)/Glu-tRNA(Gln) amidotransferase subunit GatC [Gammaproteobacteria bacterium]